MGWPAWPWFIYNYPAREPYYTDISESPLSSGHIDPTEAVTDLLNGPVDLLDILTDPLEAHID